MYQILNQPTKIRQLLYLFIEGMSKRKKDETLTVSSISLVWAADKQNLALDSMMGVAGKPTTTTPMFRFSISRPNALPERTTKIIRMIPVESKQQQHEGLSMLIHTGLCWSKPVRPQFGDSSAFFQRQNACSQKPFFNSIPRWSSSKGFTVLSSNKAERSYVAEDSLLAGCF